MRYLIIICIIFIASSCYQDVIDTVPENPAEVTTIDILNNVDSCQNVSIIGSELYIIDTSGLVKYHVSNTSKPAIPIHPIVLFSMLGCIFLIGFGMGVAVK